jgi:hypothetical protein
VRSIVARLSLLVLLVAATAAAEDPPVPDLADGRTGKIHFESVTPTGLFVLVKRQVTQKTTIFGTLRLPKRATAPVPVPAMVIAHGSAGVAHDREFWWADHLNDIGIAAFVVDSFTPRSIRETSTDQTQLSTAANAADALAALRLLTTHPKIDPKRIGVIGFSKGGQSRSGRRSSRFGAPSSQTTHGSRRTCRSIPPATTGRCRNRSPARRC